jgi:predicted MFS family arabinose efflux permease
VLSRNARLSPGLVALLLLTALNLVNFIDRYVLPGVQPLVQHEFGVNDERMGALTTAFFVTYMLAAPVTGWLGDRLPRKPLIIGGALLWSVATLSTAFVHSYAELYWRHAVVGVGEATFSIFAPAMLADFYPESERNRIFSIFYIAIPVGAALGYLLAGAIGPHYGWRAPVLVGAVPGLLIALALFFFVREPVRGAADQLVPDFTRSTFRGFLKNPAFWFATLGLATLTFSMGGISVWLPTFFVRFGGYTLLAANQRIGLVTVVDGVFGTITGGWLAQRWLRHNYRALYLVSALSALLAVPGALVVFFGPRSLMLPATVVAEFFLFLGTGPLNAAIVNSVAARIRCGAVAVNLFMIHFLGDAPSPTIIGWVSDSHGLRIGLGLTLITMLISCAILFSGSRFAPRIAAPASSSELA